MLANLILLKTMVAAHQNKFPIVLWKIIINAFLPKRMPSQTNLILRVKYQKLIF